MSALLWLIAGINLAIHWQEFLARTASPFDWGAFLLPLAVGAFIKS